MAAAMNKKKEDQKVFYLNKHIGCLNITQGLRGKTKSFFFFYYGPGKNRKMRKGLVQLLMERFTLIRGGNKGDLCWE